MSATADDVAGRLEALAATVEQVPIEFIQREKLASMASHAASLIRSQAARIEKLEKALRGLTDDISGLIDESEGVYGLHLNGDPSPWDELVAGGRFERLTHLPDAAAALERA